MKAKLLLASLVLMNSVVFGAEHSVNMRVSPKFASAPADLFIYVSVERHAENRYIRVTAESSEFFRGSEISLDGEDSARVTVFRFRQLPPGYYDIRADLIGVNGRTRDVARSQVTLM